MRRHVPAWPVVLVARGILALALLLAFGCSSARGPVSVQIQQLKSVDMGLERRR